MKPIQEVKPIPREPQKPVVPQRKQVRFEGKDGESETATPAPVETVEAQIPSHCILRKDSHLKNNHNNLARNDTLLHGEFQQIVSYVKDHVKKDRNIAHQPEYKLHNRYKDIGEPIYLCDTDASCFQFRLTITMCS